MKDKQSFINEIITAGESLERLGIQYGKDDIMILDGRRLQKNVILKKKENYSVLPLFCGG